MLQDRQVGMVDARGDAASFKGKTTFDLAGGRVGAPSGHRNVPGRKGQVIVGHGFSAQANIMVSDQTVKNLAETNDRFIDIRVYDAKMRVRMDGKIDRVVLEDIPKKRVVSPRS